MLHYNLKLYFLFPMLYHNFLHSLHFVLIESLLHHLSYLLMLKLNLLLMIHPTLLHYFHRFLLLNLRLMLLLFLWLSKHHYLFQMLHYNLKPYFLLPMPHHNFLHPLHFVLKVFLLHHLSYLLMQVLILEYYLPLLPTLLHYFHKFLLLNLRLMLLLFLWFQQ